MSTNRLTGPGAGGGANGSITSGSSGYRQPRWKPSVFDFKKAGSTCPTCQGTGRIPKGRESVKGWRRQLCLPIE